MLYTDDCTNDGVKLYKCSDYYVKIGYSSFEDGKKILDNFVEYWDKKLTKTQRPCMASFGKLLNAILSTEDIAEYTLQNLYDKIIKIIGRFKEYEYYIQGLCREHKYVPNKNLYSHFDDYILTFSMLHLINNAENAIGLPDDLFINYIHQIIQFEKHTFNQKNIPDAAISKFVEISFEKIMTSNMLIFFRSASKRMKQALLQHIKKQNIDSNKTTTDNYVDFLVACHKLLTPEEINNHFIKIFSRNDFDDPHLLRLMKIHEIIESFILKCKEKNCNFFMEILSNKKNMDGMELLCAVFYIGINPAYDFSHKKWGDRIFHDTICTFIEKINRNISKTTTKTIDFCKKLLEKLFNSTCMLNTFKNATTKDKPELAIILWCTILFDIYDSALAIITTNAIHKNQQLSKTILDYICRDKKFEFLKMILYSHKYNQELIEDLKYRYGDIAEIKSILESYQTIDINKIPTICHLPSYCSFGSNPIKSMYSLSSNEKPVKCEMLDITSSNPEGLLDEKVIAKLRSANGLVIPGGIDPILPSFFGKSKKTWRSFLKNPPAPI